MKRICSHFRQRLTDSRVSQLMLLTHEGPATLSREQLVDVYVWYRKNQRRIQLPDPVAGLCCTSGPTT